MRSEFAALEAIRRLLPEPPDNDEVWIGDDAAVLPVPPGVVLLLAADAVIGGVHADLGLTSVADFGWKALSAAVSDIAAMGGAPAHAVVTVAGPPGTDLDLLYQGIGEAARAWRCPVVGGDLVNSSELMVSVAVTGSCDGRPVLRSGARPGDDIWVSGPLGASAAGLRSLRKGTAEPALVAAHARPAARVAEGRAARLCGATAMIDVSDGLAADLSHVAAASEVGIALESVPVAPGATFDEALGGGEDFELAFCVPAGTDVTTGFGGLREPVRVGRCTDRRGDLTLRGEPLEPKGWEHRW